MAKNVFTTTTKNVFVGRNVTGQKGLLVIAYFCSSHRHLSFLFQNFFCRLDVLRFFRTDSNYRCLRISEGLTYTLRKERTTKK